MPRALALTAERTAPRDELTDGTTSTALTGPHARFCEERAQRVLGGSKRCGLRQMRGEPGSEYFTHRIAPQGSPLIKNICNELRLQHTTR